MTFKDDIDAAGVRYWKAAYEDRETDILDACVNKIDELESDLENLSGIVQHLHRQLGAPADLKAQQDLPGLIPGLSQDVLKDLGEVIKMSIVQKKREFEKEK